jgi:DNA-binding response OmpR family regulator
VSRILIVEDETHIAAGLRFNLEAEGHAVVLVSNGEDALDLLLRPGEQFEALVLDVMLPGKDGFEVARELRASRNYTPLLMLTARGRPQDVLLGFEAGADDYLPKPFNLSILLARIESLLRRGNWTRAPESDSGSETQPAGAVAEVYRFDDKVFDFRQLLLRSGEQTFQLTLMESQLLLYLVRNAGRPVSRKSILQDVWDLHEDTDTRAIDNFIVRLRRYIEPEPSKPRYLLTVRGLGYQFVPGPGATAR